MSGRPLADLLAEVVRKYRLQGELDKARLPRYWQEVVGPAIARRSSIASFEEGILRVHVREAAWRAEITMRKEELRTQLNARIGSDMVRDIIVR